MGKITSLLIGPKLSPLEALVSRAAQAELEVRKYEATVSGDQLSARGYIADYEAQPGADKAEAKTILSAAMQPGCRELANALQGTIRYMKQWRRTSAIRQLPHLEQEASSTIARLGCTRASFMLAAAMQFAETNKDPGMFGSIDDRAKRDAAIKNAVALRLELFKQLEETWQRSDVDVTYLKDGAVRLGVRFTGGEVIVTDCLAMHLTDWWIANRSLARAA